MHKLMAVASLALLAGCAHFPTSLPNPVTPGIAQSVVDGWGLAQSAAIGYLALPRCDAAPPTVVGVPICADHAVIAKIKAVDKVGTPAALQLAKYAQDPTNYPNLNVATVYATVKSALGALQQIESAGGIK